KEEFDKYLEKVVDVSLSFAPTAEDSTQLALTLTTDSSRYLKQCCVTLGISNIRVIKRIERAVDKLSGLLSDFDDQVSERVIQSLVLLGFCVYEPRIAPSLEYLKSRADHYIETDGKPSVTDQEASWNALLDAYGFTILDELDTVLVQGLQHGY